MCGFVGLIGAAPVAPQLLLGLQAIQHRGQDAAGLGVFSEGRIRLQKDLGMRDLINELVLSRPFNTK